MATPVAWRMSNLDAKLRTVMRKEVKLLHQRLKTTSIYVTHDQTEAMTMADRIVVMNAGRIEQIGTPLALYRRPDNLFVAGFIGAPQMNFVAGQVRTGAQGFELVHAAGSLVLPPGLAVSDGQQVILGVRPEYLRLQAEGGLSAVVTVVEPIGNETHLSCRLGSEEIRLIESAEIDTRPGDRLSMAFDSNKAHVFDGATGLRVASLAA